MKFLTELLNNKILLIIIILIIANYFTKGEVFNIIKKYINKIFKFTEGFKSVYNNQSPYPKLDLVDNMYASTFPSPNYNINQNKEYNNNTFTGLQVNSNTTPSIIHDSDFIYIYKPIKNDTTVFKFYNFLQSLLTIYNNNELTTSGNKVKLNNSDTIMIKKYLNKILNCGEFKFKNIKFIDELICMDNMTGKELLPFRLSSNVYNNNIFLGKMTFHFEMFIRMDTTFSGPISNGFPTITRIKLLSRDEDNKYMNEPEDDNDYMDNSLIPDSINFSTDYNNTQTED